MAGTPRRLIWDIETNGFLDVLDTLHSLVLRDADTGEIAVSGASGSPGSISAALDCLNEAETLIGHNILKFDCPALEKVYPSIRIPREKCLDTLLLARVLWPEIKAGDFLRFKRGLMPGNLIGAQGLEAWGYRLGEHKGDYTDWCRANGIEEPWATWRPEMQTYCDQDTAVNLKLWERIRAKNLDPRCIALEHETALLCMKITANGWPFDVAAATELYTRLMSDKETAAEKLREAFPPIERRSVFIPKVNSPKFGYVKGVPMERVQVETFNPGSREEIGERLVAKYGWKPTVFTDTGKPQIDETIVGGLPYPEAPLVAEYLFLDKTCSFFAGKQKDKGWLRLERNGFIHADYNTLGTVTGRASHARPNIGQVPSVEIGPDKHPLMGAAGFYGWELRNLFGVPPGWTLVGSDMSGLELRCLAHYLAGFDDGAYVKAVTEGDVHTTNMEAAGLTSRANAKTFIYGYLYGAGDLKVGTIVDPLASDEEKTRRGKELKGRFLKRTPGLEAFKKALKKNVTERGFLFGLDGRPLTIRKEHAALNTLLQSAGAILCKRWIVSVEQNLLRRGLSHSWDGDFAFLGWIHDELQTAARTPEIAAVVRDVCIEEAAKAGEHYKFRCPTAGEAKIGRTWAETH